MVIIIFVTTGFKRMVKMTINTGSLYKNVVIIRKKTKKTTANNNQCPHHCRLLAESTHCSELEVTSSPSVSLPLPDLPYPLLFVRIASLLSW
jgi:hypothetical protein